MDGILFSDKKTRFNEKLLNPVVCYQIEHKTTNRLFYQCNRNEYYTLNAAREKFNRVNKFMVENYGQEVVTQEWELIPYYQEEISNMDDKNFTIIMSETDWLGI